MKQSSAFMGILDYTEGSWLIYSEIKSGMQNETEVTIEKQFRELK